MSTKAVILRLAERSCWVLCVLCVLPLSVTTAARRLVKDAPPPPVIAAKVPAHAEHEQGISQRLWSPTRRLEYRRLRDLVVRVEIARLLFPSLDEQVPVFSTDDEVSMTLGAGHLPDTSAVDGDGNIAITSHRDGAFRILKDLETGDHVVLQTAVGPRNFEIVRRLIVNPDRVDVIAPTRETTLTLITCYPFYFVGKAPQRFIVQAELVATEPAGFKADTHEGVRATYLRN